MFGIDRKKNEVHCHISGVERMLADAEKYEISENNRVISLLNWAWEIVTKIYYLPEDGYIKTRWGNARLEGDIATGYYVIPVSADDAEILRRASNEIWEVRLRN